MVLKVNLARSFPLLAFSLHITVTFKLLVKIIFLKYFK